MKRNLFVVLVTLLALFAPATAGAHDLDHDPPDFIAPDEPVGTSFNSGGPNADWELITSVASGNPHTDLDFFTQGGETYAAVGTLGVGINKGGQTIVRLTDNGEVSAAGVEFVSAQPSAFCVSNPGNTLGLQHDVEATPKGDVLLNTPNPSADRRDAQLIIDATDNPGRCHDNGADMTVPTYRLDGQPLGGLEIIDITNIEDPVEIGMTSHIGESHTVNVDPKRPHIAYSVTSDAVSVSVDDDDIDGDGNRTELIRENEDPNDSDRFDLDGFEVVDMSSCMNFSAGTTVDAKRAACRPEVYRYRYPNVRTALGHTNTTSTYGCHELEVYPNDRLACGSGGAAVLFDMSGAFDDNGTPNDFSDDTPMGTPLPCRVRPSSSDIVNQSGAEVIDCVDSDGDGAADLTVPEWIDLGSPRLTGVEVLGAAHHQGRGGPLDSTQDIDFNHETELTSSGRFMISTDERGGGVTPPGASCDSVDANKQGNGGLHAYAVSRLDDQYPQSQQEAFDAYARTPHGDKAIYRAQIRTGAEPTVCTAHVFQQIPGQNRIFMGWYSQGTQVVDYFENADGTFEWKFAGYFIPENANTWTSHIFKMQQNPNGTYTYWGATGDFLLAGKGRDAVDIYKVTMPRPAMSAQQACRQPEAITGTSGNDALVGTNGADIICGRGGNDGIRGRGGADLIFGNGGNDTIKGGGGRDDALGGHGADSITGGKAKDKLRGSRGRDAIDGSVGNDVLNGGAGSDTLRGNSGFDTASGGPGGDFVQGGSGDDLVRGNAGGDDLRGFSGNDVLRGGGGNDSCSGGGGRDKQRSCER